MFCPQCGSKCPDDSRFCESCGNPLTPAPSHPAISRKPDILPMTASESVQKAQIIPPPVTGAAYDAARYIAPPVVQANKPPLAGVIAVAAAVLLLLAAAGGGVFYLFHTRAANEEKLSKNLMEYMWAYCEQDILDYYDDALSEPYSEKGYKVERKGSSFKLRSETDKDVFPVSGRVDIIDRSNGDASYRVNIEGTVKTNFMRTKYTWDLEYDFEEPLIPEQQGEPVTLPGDQPVEDGNTQAPVENTNGDSAAVPGSTDAAQSGYLWPTDSQYITNADLDNFTRKEIMLMRNELYARYGCSFQDEEIRTYFLSQSWYEPNPDLLAIDFQRNWFNDYETANLDTILNYERAMGWKK